MRIQTVLLFLLLARIPSSAQSVTDSLRSVISRQIQPSGKAELLATLCEKFRLTNRDSLFKVSRELYDHGVSHKNTSWQANGNFYTATFFNLSGRPDTALQIAEQTMKMIEPLRSEQLLLAKLYSLAGNSLMRLNRQKDALQMFYSCLQEAEESDDHDAQFKAQNNIGWAYMELAQYDKAIENFRDCIATIRKYNLADRYGSIYNNLASCYGSVEKYDSVYKYASTGIEIATRYNDYATMANGYSIIGTFQAKQKKFKEALSSFQHAVAVREKIGDPFFIVSDLAEISELQSHTGQSAEGIETGRKALAIATEKNIEAKLPMIYTALAHNYEQAGDFEAAAASYKMLNTLKDSLYKDANPRALAEIQTKYETVKKEQQIEQQQHRIRMQNFLFAGIAVLVLLGGMLAYSYYKRNRLRQDAKMKTALMKQQELAAKAVMEAEENERQRIARDLHDGVGQMMSAAKMNLSAIESDIRFTDNGQQQAFTKLIHLVDESCREVRNVSHTMMPNALLKSSLAAAIEEFVDKLDKNTIRVHVYTEGIGERFDSNTELVLYRVLQECVTNVIRHSGASTLDISVTRDKDGINATIEDNGNGFDTSDREKFRGMGIRNILTRIEFLKGNVDFDSAPGRGTVVALHVPA